MTPKRQRLWFVSLSVVFLCAATLLSLQAMRDSIVFFYTPSELLAKTDVPEPIRLGGLVAAGSVVQGEGDVTRFIVEDGAASLKVEYHGVLPNLFREGQGVVAEGALEAGRFVATRVLAKHDENYMPPEVAKKLKQDGYWREGAAQP